MGITGIRRDVWGRGSRASNKIILAGVVGVLSIWAAGARAVTYTVINLGAAASEPDTVASSINNNGEVAISSLDPGEDPALYTGGSPVPITSLANNGDFLQQVNNSGLAVGNSTDGSGNIQAVYASATGPAAMTPLAQLTEGGQGSAFGLSPTGAFGTATIVGASLNGASNFQAVKWTGTNTITALTPTNSSAWNPATSSEAYAINSLGVVVGQSISTVSGNLDAFVTASDGSWVNIAANGSNQSLAEAINALGVVVGRWTDISGNQHAFEYSTAGGVQTLGDLFTPLDLYSSDAEGINLSGQIVGQSLSDADGDESAVIYNGAGTPTDLNTELDPTTGAGWTLTNAASINDAGDIVGTGFLGGNQEAFELVPMSAVPEPTSAMMLGGATLLLLGRRRRAMRR